MASVQCCRRWLAVTVCEIVTMENLFSFPQTAIIETCRRHADNPYVKSTASSSSLLTRLRLMQTSSPRAFNAFITLAMARRCSGASFFNRRALSQFTFHSYARYNTTRERSEKRRSSLKWVMQGQVQPV